MGTSKSGADRLPAVSIARAALGWRCPRCGKGPLFAGLLVGMLRPFKADLIALQYRHHLLAAPPT
jgi:uncharacterized protein (DUF983 family)